MCWIGSSFNWPHLTHEAQLHLVPSNHHPMEIDLAIVATKTKDPKRESWFQAWNEVTWQLDNPSILYLLKAYFGGGCFVLISQINIRGWSGTRKPESKNSWPRVKPDPIRNARQTRFWKKLHFHLLCISKPELLPETRSTKPETRNDGFRKTRLDFRKKSTRSFSSKHVETISLK